VLGAVTNIYSSTSAPFSPPAGVLVNTNNSWNVAVYLGDASHLTGGLAVWATTTNWVADGDATFANSGTVTIGGQNTSGINTYNNPIILGWTANHGKSVTLVAATGGTVNFAGGLRANGTDTSAGVTAGTYTFGGTVELSAANSYAGPTTISYGTLVLGAAGTLSASSSVSIAAGATFDVSALSAYTLGTSASLTASGAASAATIKGGSSGTVSLGSRPITLNFDGTDPALTISQGTLSLAGNIITINGSVLASGSYTIIHQASGSVTHTGSYTAAGSALPGGNTTATIQFSGGNVNLVIAENTSTSLARTTGSGSQTYGSALTYTATVASLAGSSTTPTGSVTFKDGSTTLATVALSSGTAAYTSYTDLNVAGSSHSITAVYVNDSKHNTSTSSAIGQTITAKSLTVTGLSVPASKPYDGTTAATVSGTAALQTAEAAASGSVSDGAPYTVDSVSLTGTPTGAYNSTTVALASTVTFGGLSLTGGGNGNYVITPPTQAAIITQATPTLALTTSALTNGYLATLSFTATVTTNGITAGDATGTVQFVTNSLGGSPVNDGLPVGLTAATVSTNLATLPRGTNYVYAVYSGDANYASVTSSTLSEIVTNHPPVAAPLTIAQIEGLTVKIPLSSLATNWSDADGDPITITNIDTVSANGQTLYLLNVVTNGDGSFVTNGFGFIGYTNTLNTGTDTIYYTITDNQGGTATGSINVVVSAAPVFGVNTVTVTPGGSSVTVNFAGIPGDTYEVERATTLSPANWYNLGNVTAALNGLFNYTDNFTDLGGTPPSSAYYRLVWNP
jgi:hypothetical protein